MDKLIKHRFWILLALVPPLVIFGYIKANGAIQAATEERVKQLDSVLTAIPDGKGPNPTFVKAEHQGLDVFNAELRKAVDVEFVRVWEDQKPRMTWPVEMATFVPDTYRGEFVRESGITYKAEYEDQIDKLWESIEPLKPIKPGTNSGVTGKVRLDRATIPLHYFGDMLVPSEAIWDAQEDLWMLQLLFDAVRNVNRPAENAAKSTVRWVYRVALMGGDGQSIVRPGAGIAGSDDEEMMAGMAGFGVGAAEEGRGRNLGMQSMRGAVQSTVAFNPSEEFGIGFEAGAGMGGGRGGADESDDEVFMPGQAMPTMSMASGGIPIRYIAFADGANFQERGFYMSVLIDQRKIADFLVELSNSDWPIKIVRFNVGPNTGGAGARAAAPMMAGGMPGGFGTGADEMLGNMAMAMGGAAGMSAMPSMPSMGRMGADEDDALSAAPGFTGADAFGGTAAGMGMAGGMIGASPLVNGDQIGQLFTHPDLVQMDLCGVITMYRPPTPELLASVTGAAAATEASVEGDADAAATDATVADPAATDSAATDPAASDAAATDPAADAAFPEVPEIAPIEDPAAFPTEDTPSDSPPADAPPIDAAPADAAPPDGTPAAGN